MNSPLNPICKFMLLTDHAIKQLIQVMPLPISNSREPLNVFSTVTSGELEFDQASIVPFCVCVLDCFAF